jgi:hypothetical protein
MTMASYEWSMTGMPEREAEEERWRRCWEPVAAASTPGGANDELTPLRPAVSDAVTVRRASPNPAEEERRSRERRNMVFSLVSEGRVERFFCGGKIFAGHVVAHIPAPSSLFP